MNRFPIIFLLACMFADCPENFVESNQSTLDTIVCYPELFEHVISTQQAGYVFWEVDIDGIPIENDDWVGAFNNDICVGAAEWDLESCGSGICSIVVYGYDGNPFSQGYMMPGQFPTFKIYDSSENLYYDVNTSNNEGWFNFQVFFVDQLTNQNFGCNDQSACNYNDLADIDDGSCEYDEDLDGSCNSDDICPGFDDFLDTDGDSVVDCLEIYGCTDIYADNFEELATEENGSCYYTYDIGLHQGPNLVSFLVFPTTEISFGTEGFIEEYFSNNSLLSIIGENSSVTFNPNGILVGSLINLERTDGYWIKINDMDIVSFTGFVTNSSLQYSLSQGANLISFPSDMSYNLLDALPESLDGVVTSIISEGESATYEDGSWYGSLIDFEGFKGYWFIVNEAVDFTFDLDAGGFARNISKQKQYLSGYEYNQSTLQSFYYIKDVPMAEEGDWIIAYNDDVVVGARQWNGYMTDIPVMGNDNEDYSVGYMDVNETPEFKLYKAKTGELIDLYSADYVPGFGNNSTPVLSRLNNTTMLVPNTVQLHGAYPNPFNPVTNIKFTVGSDQAFVELNIIDIQGRLVDKLVRNSYAYGEHEVMFDANILSSGIYFVQLITEKDIKYSKIVLLK